MTANMRCGSVVLLGESNAGKSTLMNHLIGGKVSIVTPKVQTTRNRITGITVYEKTQVIFVDTPGIFSPRKALDRAMVAEAWNSLAGADCVAVIVDAAKPLSDDLVHMLKSLKDRYTGSVLLLLNKIDRVKKHKLLERTQELAGLYPFQECFMISALKGDGTEDVMRYLSGHLPKGQWHYPEDQMSDIPLRMMAAETTREKLMLGLEHELPYSLMVYSESWEERPPSPKHKNGKVVIHQVIFVTNDSHKRIVVGKGGQKIREVGEQSRKELAWMLGQDVDLFLFVKVNKNWMQLEENYHMMGLELPKK